MSADLTWWQQIRSVELNDLESEALANNPDIAAAVVRVREADAELRLARGAALPSVSLAGGIVRERDVDAFGHPQLQRAWSAEGSAAYDLDLFDRLKNSTAAARAGLQESAAARDAVHLAVTAAVAQGYIDLVTQHDALDVANRALEARRGSVKVAQRRFTAGYGTELDLRQAQAEYQAAAALIPATQLAIQKDEDALALLIGNAPKPLEIHRHLTDLVVPDVPVGLPSDVLRSRPDIAAAEDAIVAADRSMDSARAAFMPSVSLTADGGYVGSTLIANPLHVFSLGSSILAPLFEGGRLHAQADLASAQRDQAAYAYRKAALAAFADVEDALAAVRQNGTREQAVESERAAIAAAYVLARNRYREGYADYLEQLDAERTLLGAELECLQVRQGRFGAAIAVFQAIGGGWQRSPETVAERPRIAPSAPTP